MTVLHDVKFLCCGYTATDYPHHPGKQVRCPACHLQSDYEVLFTKCNSKRTGEDLLNHVERDSSELRKYFKVTGVECTDETGKQNISSDGKPIGFTADQFHERQEKRHHHIDKLKGKGKLVTC